MTQCKSFNFNRAGGKAFVAGADILQMQNSTSVEILQLMELGHRTLRMIETMPKPSIAAVNGFALGGGTEIALACDIRFAAENALFGRPEILIGVIPGWGGNLAPAAPSRHGNSQRNDSKRHAN
jgi:enoyl-CoA hydratase